MKKYISKLLLVCTLGMLVVSCQDDEPLTRLAAVSFSEGLTATPNTVVLTPANKYETVTTISWPEVNFPIDAPVTYALQVDIPADTIGTAAWANAKNFAVGEDVLSKSFTGADLNTLALELGLPVDVAGGLVVRVAATMDRTVYSHGIALTVTPFIEVITLTQIYVPGGYQGWNPATAATLSAIENGVFQGFLTFPEGQLEFKFTTEANWENPYGNDANGNFALGGTTTNLAAPAAGSYQITVNLNNLTYTLTPYAFGIIGTATPGQWANDTDMAWDYQNHYWTWTGDLISGALKFRLNDAWTVNYGTDANGTVMYFDNQGAHNVTTAGTYKVTFAVNPDPATAAYSVTLQ